MQILLINDVLYGILSGAYSTVARIYSIMLDLAGVTSGDRTLELGVIGSFSNITTAIYTIAGVFMLFRVTIAMINMLINPDMVSDRNAGAGKILTRVITSVAMLIIFIPNGWVFGDNGILNRLERGLLAEDGLINRILPSGVSESTSTKESKDLLVENVYAADSLDCWYLYVNSNDQSKNADSKGKHINISKVYHITYRADDKGRYVISSRDATHREEEQGVVPDNAGISYNVASGNLESDITDVITASVKSYSALGRPIVAGDVFKDGKLPNKCPKYFKVNSSGSYVPYADYTTSGDSWLKSSSSNNPRGGFSSISSLNKYVDKYKDQLLVKSEDTAEATADLLDGVKPQAVRFGQNTMGSFLQCSKGKDDECEGIVANSLTTSAGNDAVVNAIDQKTMTMDFMIGLIAAVGIAIWLIIMCVDVIVRRFKLILLQIIAPIPIISYSDPKDKMFGQWAKMYMTVYADLFLKLIAIGFATALLENIGDTLSGKGLLVFFYIVAILVFAKVLPSLLSELFGFKMGNSFKDITGMGKAALGFGAGAAIGAAAGSLSAFGEGGNAGMAMLGGVKGALRGAGSGISGKPLAGAKSVAAENKAIREANRNGSTFLGRTGARLNNLLGIDNASEIEAQAIERGRIDLEPVESGIATDQEALDARKRALEPEKHTQQNHQNYQANVKGFSDRVEKFMGYHQYDNLGEVQEYWDAKSAYDNAYIAGADSATLKALEKEKDGKFYTAAQAAKNYEISRGSSGDAEAQMYLENVRDIGRDLGGNYASFTSWENDLQAKNAASTDAANDIGNMISRTEYQISLDQSAIDQRKRDLDLAKHDLDVRERDNKRSANQADVNAVNGKK